MATKNPEQQKLLDKVETLKIDLEYKTKAYIAAYSFLSKMKSQMEHVPAVQELITEWVEKDEVLYQAWMELSRDTKRQQRARRKAELHRQGGKLMRIAPPSEPQA